MPEMCGVGQPCACREGERPIRNFEANRWLTVGEALAAVEKLSSDSERHTIDLGDAGYHDVDCDRLLNMEDVQIALLGVSRERE